MVHWQIGTHLEPEVLVENLGDGIFGRCRLAETHNSRLLQCVPDGSQAQTTQIMRIARHCCAYGSGANQINIAELWATCLLFDSGLT